MKSDEDVRMISAEAPVLFAKACEFFIIEMTLRAWNVAEEHKRRTLQRCDIASAISRTEVWDFLLDTVPLEAEGGAAPQIGNNEGGGGGGSAPSSSPGGVPPSAAAAAGGGGPPSQIPPMGMYQGQFMPPMGLMPPPGGGPQGMPLLYPGMAPPPGMFMAPPPGMDMSGMGIPQQQGGNSEDDEDQDDE